MKKRWISLLLILVLLLTACGSGKSAEPAKDAEGSAAAEQETVPAETAEAEAPVEMKLGVVEGDTYKNEALGIGCTFEGWTYYTNEQLAEENGWDAYPAPEDQKSVIDSADDIMDMMVSSEDNLSNVNVSVKNMPHVFGVLVDEDRFMEMVSDGLEESLIEAGYSSVKVEKSTVQFAGEEHPCITIQGEMSGIPLCQRVVGLVRGDYLAAVTATSYKDDHTPEMFAKFFSL